jgi:hypothetical protein
MNETWSAATQPAPDGRGGTAPAALRRADSADREAAAHVAHKSRTLFARLFRLRGRLSSADSLEPATTSPAASPATGDPGDHQPPPPASVSALFRSFHLRGKSVLTDDHDGSSSSGSSDSSRPPASDSAGSSKRNGRGRRLVEHHAPAQRPINAEASVSGVLMESVLTKVTPHRYWHSKVRLALLTAADCG